MGDSSGSSGAPTRPDRLGSRVEQFSTAAGDRIRVDCAEPARSFDDDVALAVRRDPAASTVDGVLTTASHADVVHELFRVGATFRISVTPASTRRSGDGEGTDGTGEGEGGIGESGENGESGATTTFEGCTLLSSSGKWIAPRQSD